MYNGKSFSIYNKDLIEELLGKNNQNPVNIASSTWKPVIKRNKTDKQEAGEKTNSKFIDLKNLIKEHILIDEAIINKPKREIVKLLSNNLKNFKSNPIFRKECINRILDKDNNLKQDISAEYFYIVFSIYVMLNFNYFSIKEEKKLSPINLKTEKEFKDKLIEILKESYVSINNLTAFSYRQYFWLDYRLSESLHSEIHTIIYEIFNDLSSESISTESSREIEKDPKDFSSFKAEERSVSDILGRADKEYVVPKYQREYSWGDRQIQSFLDDLFSHVIKDNCENKYFLGNIVLKEVPEGYEVVDGQQRLSTILIMLNVLRELTSSKELKKLVDKYLTVEKEVDLERKIRPKLSLTEINNKMFTLYFGDIQSEGNRKASIDKEKFSGSNELIYVAYRKIHKYIKDHISSLSYPQEELSKIKRCLLENLKFIEIISFKNREIYLIFETLNDRGMLLKPFEMIKNHILGKAKNEDVKTLEILWEEIIKDYSYNDKLSNYLLPIYRSKYSEGYRLKEDDIFFDFRDKVSRDSYIKFTRELKEELYIYDNIMNPTEDYWGEKIHMKLEILKGLGVKGLYSMILSAKVKNFYFSHILDLCLNLAFKYKYGVKLPYSYNDLYHELSSIIRKEGSVYDDLVKKMEKADLNKINLEQMKQNFFNERTYEEKKTLAKSILITINKYGNINNPINWKNLTVEHILSQSGAQSNEIGKIEESTGEHFNLNNIYNLTLISKKDGEKWGNKGFSEKVECYKKYEIFTNKKLVKIHETHKAFTPQAFSEYKDFLWKRTKMVFSLEEFNIKQPPAKDKTN